MSTPAPVVPAAGGDDAALGRLDSAAVLDHFAKQLPIAPDLAERVRARAAQITAGILRDHGLVDDETFQSLLDDEA